MAYTEIRPTDALAPWVECFWTRRDDAPSTEPARVLPDGCADLVFDLKVGDAEVVGTMTRPLLLEPVAQADFLGVRFRPGRAAAFLRIPLAEITDTRVPLGDVWKSWDGRIDIPSLEQELLRRLDPDRDRRVDAAIARIAAGASRIEDVANEIGISRQHLSRQFLHHVGVTPKTFARVLRFRRLLEAVEDRQSCLSWSDIALEHGYYDQSHLIAEFRELASATPASFHFSNR